MALDSWETLTPFTAPVGGSEATAGARVGSKLYAFAGTTTLEVAVWSPNVPTWEKIGEQASAGGNMIGGDLTVAGDTIFFQKNGFQSFNTTTGLFGGPHAAWPPDSSNQGPKWYYHGGLLWQFGGYDGFVPYDDRVWTYNPDTNVWTDAGMTEHEPRAFNGGSVHKVVSKVYMHPGTDSSGFINGYSSAGWQYFDLITQELVWVATHPTGFTTGFPRGIGFASDGGRYALRVGGHDNSSNATPETGILDYQDNTYTVKSDHPRGGGLYLHTVMRLGDYFYTIGGFFGTQSDMFCRYTPDVSLGAEIGDFTGTDGPTITPAPEKMPHVITLDDVGGNQSFQRKLQDNFDTIERQLLALDPDNQGNKDPNR